MREPFLQMSRRRSCEKVFYFHGSFTCQFPIETGQADGEGLEWAEREAEVHGEHVWGHAAELKHQVVG